MSETSSAKRVAGGAPGWFLVPREPTLEMLHALYDPLGSVVFEGTSRELYARMLIAAPPAPPWLLIDSHTADTGLFEAADIAERIEKSCLENAKIHSPPYEGANSEIAAAHENGAAIAHQIAEVIRALVRKP